MRSAEQPSTTHDPLGASAREGVELSPRDVQGNTLWRLGVLPREPVEIEMLEAMLRRKPPRECGLAGSRVADDGDAPRS